MVFVERRLSCGWNSPSFNSSVLRCHPKPCNCVLMDLESSGQKPKFRVQNFQDRNQSAELVKKHQLSENVTYSGYDPANFRSDHGKQACDCKAIPDRGRFVFINSSLAYSWWIKNVKAVHAGFHMNWLGNKNRPRWTAARSCLDFMTPVQQNFSLIWWLVMSRGSAMP